MATKSWPTVQSKGLLRLYAQELKVMLLLVKMHCPGSSQQMVKLIYIYSCIINFQQIINTVDFRFHRQALYLQPVLQTYSPNLGKVPPLSPRSAFSKLVVDSLFSKYFTHSEAIVGTWYFISLLGSLVLYLKEPARCLIH